MGSFNPRGFYLERQGQGVLKNKAVDFAKATSIIGRDEKVEVVLVSRVISRQHCKIEIDSDGRLFIEDLKSANGTFLNGTKIVQRTEMEAGDLIGIGFNNENEKFLNQAEYFVFKVKLGTVVTLSSDEEDDINEFFKIMNQEREIPMEYNEAEEEVISLSSDEETDIDKEWRKKLKKLPHSVRECSVVLEHLPIAFTEDVIKESRKQIEKVRQTEKYQMGRKKTSYKKINQEGSEKTMTQLLAIVDSDSEEEPKGTPNPAEKKKYLARKSIPRNTAMRTSVFEPKFEILKSIKKRSKSTSISDTDNQRKHTSSHMLLSNEKKIMKKRRMTISLDDREVKDNKVAPFTLNIRQRRQSKAETPIKLEISKVLNSTHTKIRKRRMTINNDYESVEKIHSNFIKNNPNIGTSRDLKRGQSAMESSAKMRQLQEVFHPNQYENPALGNVKSRECADRAREARQEKLRELSEKQKAIEEEKRIIEAEKSKIAKEKSISTGKVKLTEKNRGDFLTALQPIPKFCKKPAIHQLPTAYKKEDNMQFVSDSSMFDDFRRKYVVQKVVSTNIGVNGVSMQTAFQTIEYGKVTRNPQNHELKKDRAKLDVEKKCRTDKNAMPTVGFYNPINVYHGGAHTVENVTISKAFSMNCPEENISRKLPIGTLPALSDKTIEETLESSCNIEGVLRTSQKEMPNKSLTKNEQRLPGKSILTMPLDRLNRKKSVRFNDNLKQVKIYEREYEFIEDLNPPNPKISIEQLKTQRSSATDAATSRSFSTFVDFILNLNVNELAIHDSNTNKIKPTVVQNLEDYKSTMKIKLENEVKMKIWTSMKAESDFMNLAITGKKNNGFGRIELILSSSNVFHVLPRSFIYFRYKTNVDSKEQNFLGFVSNVFQLAFSVEAKVPYESFNDVAVLKSRIVLKNCNDFKSFVALSSIEDSLMMSEIIDPLKMKISDDGNYQLSEIHPDQPLKPDQEKCIRQIASKAAGLVIIKGAPATGKTKVLVGSIEEIFRKAKQNNMSPPDVLICCPHKGSVEDVASSILKHVTNLGVKLLQVGKVIGVLGEFSLRNQTKKAEDEQEHDRRWEDVRPGIIAGANIIVATTLSSYELRNTGKRFDICFVDNASECTETELLIPLHLNFPKLVLIGDQYALKDSLIARAVAAFENDGKKKLPFLNCQFRCNKDIYKYVNDKFYNGIIANDATVITRKPIRPYIIFDLKKDFYFEKLLAETIWRITQKPVSIAILSPCLQHNCYIQDSLEMSDRFKIFTLESIKGLEVDVLIVSTSTDLGILDNPQALHTVLARAKQGLYICGNFSNLKISENWKKILEDAKERNSFYTVNNDEINLISILKV